MDKKQTDSPGGPYRKPKQIAAWICIISLVALYIATFLKIGRASCRERV